MDDLLLGYALNALDPADRRSVEARLCDDPVARRRLELLRRSLAPLAADRDNPEPPPGLVARTLERILPLAAGFSPRGRGLKPAVTNDACMPSPGWRRADVFIA